MLLKRTAVWLVLLSLPCGAISGGAMFRGAMAADAPPGASSCSGCHAVSRSIDTPVSRLIGGNPADIVAAMQEFRAGQRPATVMDRIVKGFTDDEIKAIADWYGAQKD
jgi:cytochrome subunit of sulfide dehydrogenase